MSIDLAQSRRDCHEECLWWERDERDEFSSNELVHKRAPAGTFWAKEINPEQLRNDIIGGVFRFDSSHVTLRTPDDCFLLAKRSIESECVVLYQDEIWIVDSVQKSKARKNNVMFAKDKYCSHYWYIELRK